MRCSVGWNERYSIIQAACLIGPVGYDSRALSPLHSPAWVSVKSVCENVYCVKIYMPAQVYTVNKVSECVVSCMCMGVGLMHVKVVFMGQSDLYQVQWALSLAEDEHSPPQSSSLCRAHPAFRPG